MEVVGDKECEGEKCGSKGCGGGWEQRMWRGTGDRMHRVMDEKDVMEVKVVEGMEERMWRGMGERVWREMVEKGSEG